MWLHIGGCVVVLVVSCCVNIIFPKLYKKIRYHLKWTGFVIGTSLISLACLPVFIPKGRHYKNCQLLGRLLSYYTSTLLGVEWRVRNAENLTKDEGAVVIINHQTALDMPATLHLVKYARRSVIVAKKSLLYSGPFGMAAYLSGTLFVDRSNPKGAYKSLTAATSLITKDKVKVWICPEGTRNTSKTGKFLPFKKGAFIIAVTTQAPIIPVVFSPYHFIDAEQNVFGTGSLIMQCMEPVPTKGLTIEDVPDLIDRVREEMQAVYDKLFLEVMSPAEHLKL